VNAEDFNYAEALSSQSRRRAYEVVHAVVSDDNNFERGIVGARAVAGTVLAEAGTAGLAETVVELALKLAEALERIASDQGLAAEDLAEVWFVE
jgi:predicted Zn-dependent protease